MKKLFATIGALLLGMTCALAQVNVVPQVGQTSNYVARQTYSAGFIGLVPAASATDIVCIAGSASKTIRVRDIVLSGSAGTLVTVPVSLIRRAAVNTGGTAAGTTANPANAITKRDTNNGTAVAALVSYTANPTITDSAGTIFAASSVTLTVTSAGAVSVPLRFYFIDDTSNLLQPPTLRGAAQQFCLNLTGVSVSSGLLNGYITWTEE